MQNASASGSQSLSDKSNPGQQGAQARDRAAALGASQVTLGERPSESNAASGVPMGGRSNGATAPSVAIELPDLLSREVIEAHDDLAGADVKNQDRRRRAEQAASGLAYTGTAGLQTFSRAHLTAPLPVPEARRALIERYFTRP
jgi:hypothetical protein